MGGVEQRGCNRGTRSPGGGWISSTGAQPHDRRSLLVALVPARIPKLASLYEGVEKVTRQGLAKLPEQDLEAVVRFFETLEAARKRNSAMSATQS
jgi:hypothetical protein